MKVMVCIPVDVAVDTTRRKDLREAVRTLLREESKFKDDTGTGIITQSLRNDSFVVRAPEAKPEKL